MKELNRAPKTAQNEVQRNVFPSFTRYETSFYLFLEWTSITERGTLSLLAAAEIELG
mgnify:CR=1 FL=1